MREKRFQIPWRLLTLLAGVTAGAVLRVWAAFDNFWLDEIMSLGLAQSISHSWEILTLHHDNNHILNTLYLFLLGKQQNWVWYRILSVVTGTASVAIIGYGTLRRGFLEATTATVLAALSYPLILYASEARGYAPALLFSLTSFFLLQGYWQRRTFWKLVLFWTSVALGLLSHFTFIYVYLSLFVWSVVYKIQDKNNRLETWTELLKCHTIPILCVILLYVASVRHMTVGGGPVYNTFEVIRRAVLLAMGVPEKGIAGSLGIITAFALLSYGIYRLQRKNLTSWIFYLCVLLLAPTFVLILNPPEHFYFRYLLVCFPFFYLLISSVLASLYRNSSLGKILYVLFLLVFIIVNMQKTADLLKIGRGKYFEAISYMAENTSGDEIVVASDHDYRNKIVLSFYGRYLPEGKKLVYRDQNKLPPNGPDWVITHNQDIGFSPPPSIRGPAGHTYTLARSFPYSGISGWHWFVYRNDSNLDGSENHK